MTQCVQGPLGQAVEKEKKKYVMNFTNTLQILILFSKLSTGEKYFLCK